ncbi:L,D-transpeptidase family protein [Azonexus sp. IMCC34839]|uniref:L,D-transpeptidase family protein n=1 Tax=Azonexus sp. IMCC34839 TaxID=3133695 RepID=UPI00399A0704
MSDPLAGCRQLLRVLAPDWASTTGELQRFARAAVEGDWQPVGEAIPVSLGRNGLAWGLGLHPASDTGPHKAEGDGRAPAGVFAITALFGSADADSDFARAARLPYLAATPDLKAIDDPQSQHYNRIVDQRTVDKDWSSCEDMLRTDERYTVGAVIAHNTTPPQPGAGSCIFLHVWENPGAPTAGCTAGALADIRDICLWLDAAASPCLVQLPQAEYAQLRSAWQLP